MYAANDPNVINASVEFDEKTLQPTYLLLIGLAGASSGIEIARRTVAKYREGLHIPSSVQRRKQKKNRI